MISAQNFEEYLLEVLLVLLGNFRAKFASYGAKYGKIFFINRS